MPRQSTRLRLTALGCVVLAGGLLLPPTATAEPTKTSTPLLDTARAVTARHTAVMKERRAEQAPASATTTDLRSGSFLKSAAGIATLVVFGAGVAYAIYSSSNDRIKSPGR
jgi:hypothetical protein